MKPIPSVLVAPWAIEPFWLRVVFGIWSRGQLDAAAVAQAKQEWEARKASRPRLDEPGAPVEGTGGTLRIVGNVGVLSITGPLFRHADIFCDISGGTSYDALWRGLEAARTTRAVEKVLLRGSSPGGEADGLNELANAIAELRQEKPVWAHGESMVASACYWLTSQAERIVVEETTEVGSIGVRCGVVDYSRQDEMMGRREIEIISSRAPGKRSHPVDDEVVARLQVRIDDLEEIFIAAVARGRGVDTDKVISDFGQGDVMIARKALDAGLIDEVGGFNETLQALSEAPAASTTSSAAARAARAHRGARTMPIIPPGADADGGGGEWQCKGCKEMMGPSADAYCAKCATDNTEPDGDEDEDEDAKAAKAFRAEVLQMLGVSTAAEAKGRIAAGVEAVKTAGELREKAAKAETESRRHTLRAVLERGLAGAPGQPPRLSLGAIQRTIPTLLRGAPKRAWTAAMENLAAAADAAKKDSPESKITGAQLIDAACSVEISAEDLDAIKEYAEHATPVAAEPHVEPQRNPTGDAADLSAVEAQVAAAAKKARETLDRNKAPAAK